MTRFKVTGLARVPVTVEITVEAFTAESAAEQAYTKWRNAHWSERRSLVVPNSANLDAVVDFSPRKTELLP